MPSFSHRMSDDERWPRDQSDVIRCHCGAPALFREYSRVCGVETDEKFVCLAHSDGTTRISCELPNPLLARLERQVELMEGDVTRQHLIQTAIEGLVRDLEECDTERTSP